MVLEAFAVGMPVVATCVGAIPDTVEHGKNGLLVPPGDSVKLADAIAELMTDPDRCHTMSVANVALYQRRFTQESFLKTQVAWIKACADGDLSPAGQFWRIPDEERTNDELLCT